MSAFQRYAFIALLLLGGFVLFFAFRLKLHLLIAYLAAINLSSFLLYGLDKFYAIRGWQRIPESLLHLLALLGGSPGALLGQQIYNHKVSKIRFLLLCWLIVIIQLLLLYAVFYTDLLKTIF